MRLNEKERVILLIDKIKMIFCKGVSRNSEEFDMLDEKLRYDLLNLFAYLSCSDGIINQDEVNFINKVLHTDYSVSDILKHIQDNNIYSKNFEIKLFESIKCLVKLGVDSEIVHELISAFNELGGIFIASDDDIAAAESRDLYNIMENQKIYSSKMLRTALYDDAIVAPNKA